MPILLVREGVEGTLALDTDTIMAERQRAMSNARVIFFSFDLVWYGPFCYKRDRRKTRTDEV
jgi:hypothetical protein